MEMKLTIPESTISAVRSLLASQAGSVKSDKKAASSRKNGKKGGRPRIANCPKCGRKSRRINGKLRTCTCLIRVAREAKRHIRNALGLKIKCN
jgi:hypothetical protein